MTFLWRYILIGLSFHYNSCCKYCAFECSINNPLNKVMLNMRNVCVCVLFKGTVRAEMCWYVSTEEK